MKILQKKIKNKCTRQSTKQCPYRVPGGWSLTPSMLTPLPRERTRGLGIDPCHAHPTTQAECTLAWEQSSSHRPLLRTIQIHYNMGFFV